MSLGYSGLLNSQRGIEKGSILVLVLGHAEWPALAHEMLQWLRVWGPGLPGP